MKVAVIGAGASGLISAKVLSDEGVNYDVFEINDQVGGTWVYTENTVDKYGLPVSSSMYRDLRTNLPKEVMEFSEYHYDIENVSYITPSQVLDYLQSFCNEYNLKDHIKLEHLVTKVSKTNGGWLLTAKDLKHGTENTAFYDAVFVCNGHYSLPNYPEVEVKEPFQGLSLHSHYFKTPDIFDNKTVLVIGMGPSAQDITFNIHPNSKQIYLSHHCPEEVKLLFPEDIIHKPDVKAIEGSTVHFVDGTEVEVDAILYCTGYKYNFPFLDENCGIQINNNYISPLYKQVFSITHPTMVFIGLPFRSFLFPMFEIQAKCALNVLTGAVNLPSKEEMLEDMKSWEKLQISRGYSENKFHMISDNVYEYFRGVEKAGQVSSPCPDLLFKIFYRCGNSRKKDLVKYRNEVFKIIDAENFIIE
ncbi:senecionine N-oxygenase [Halyomorpha halys]|uniref:senecionine N-oxygenase n=1 Tax=Halyomorpha halys TaxID=286706 RepID=UPI0006D4CB42|nr:dimethylaniline monooxygenase [N-oxide-forming] 3-like [Halyomorpha halys]